jgi:N-acetylmuramoyl-L-alanine amidase
VPRVQRLFIRLGASRLRAIAAVVALATLGCGAPEHRDGDPLALLVESPHTIAAPTPVVSSARLTSLEVTPGPSSARVDIAFDRAVRFERDDLAATAAMPHRLVLAFTDASIGEGVEAARAVDAAGLTRVRASTDDDGLRITFDLEEDATPRVRMLDAPPRLVVEVTRPDPNAPTVARSGRRPLRLVVLDPGHGGDDYGARAFHLRESDLTLDIALRTREALLRRRPDIRVILTREDDTFVSLEQRTAMANAMNADAFVSIHLNAAWEEVDHGGVTTFVLDTTNDRQALRLAARENGTHTGDVTELERILAHLERGEQSEASSVLASRIHVATLTAGRRILPQLHDRGVRAAMFYVLVGATMPAVLVEASFMTRADEASALRTQRYRDTIAGGIADGIARSAALP